MNLSICVLPTSTASRDAHASRLMPHFMCPMTVLLLLLQFSMYRLPCSRSALRPALAEAMPEPAFLRRPYFSQWWQPTCYSCYAHIRRMLRWEAAHAAILIKCRASQPHPSDMPWDKIQRLGEADHPGPSQPGNLDLQERTFTIVNHDGSEANLNRSEVGSRGLWRFQAPPMDEKRRVSSDCKTPQGALMSWLRLHGETLDQNSKLQLEEVCTQYRPSRHESVRARSTPATAESQQVNDNQELMDEKPQEC